MNKKILGPFLVLVVFSFLFCKESKPELIEFKELIGMDYNVFEKNSSNLLKNKCSPYVLYKKEIETDSSVTYIYLSDGKCRDAAYEIIIDKRSNKITGIKNKNMA
jgi:hypothetical protein